MPFRTKILATLALFMVLVSALISVVMIMDAARRTREEQQRNWSLVTSLASDWVRAQPAIAEALRTSLARRNQDVPNMEHWAQVNRAVGASTMIMRLRIVELDFPEAQRQLPPEQRQYSFTVKSDSDPTDRSVSAEERASMIRLSGSPPPPPLYVDGTVYLRLNARTGPEWIARIWVIPTTLPAPGIGPVIREVVSVMALGTVILLLVVYVLLNRLVLRPIDALSEASQRIARSDFSRPVAASASYDEVNRMVDSFNLMMEKLGAYHHKLNEDVRQAEERTHHTERRLLVAQRLSTTGSLAAGIAHEINNPLGGLLNAAESLRDGNLPEAKRVEYIALIAEGLNRIREILGQILKFTPRPFEMRQTDLREIVPRALALADHRFKERDVQREYAPPEALSDVMIDPAEVVQALLNVVLNALDAVEPGRGRVEIRLDEGTGGVTLSVHDNGCGMTEEQLSRCLDPFFTTKEQGQGSGIGLAVTHSIISNHGGQLAIESEPGSGTTITLVFPKPGATRNTRGRATTADEMFRHSEGGKA